MRRGGVVWVDLDPAPGSTASKQRPGVVVSNGESSGLPPASKAQAEQVRSIDVTRVDEVAGHLAPDVLTGPDAGLRLHLGL